MNWDAIGAVSELMGALGVIATLLYLSIQVRQNSKMMKANSKQSISDASQQLIYKMADEVEVMQKGLFEHESLNPIEYRKLWFLSRAMLRGYEAQIFQHKVGLLDESEWNDLKRVIVESVSYPGFASVWSDLSPAVSDELRNIIESETSLVTK